MYQVMLTFFLSVSVWESSDHFFWHAVRTSVSPSSVFQPCHSVISPGPFVDSCVSDNCNGGNNTCSSLEAYATQCSNKGICINWRNATNGQCGKIYIKQCTILQLFHRVLKNVYKKLQPSYRAQVSKQQSVQSLWPICRAYMRRQVKHVIHYDFFLFFR